MLSNEFQEIIDRRRSNRKFDPLVEVPDDVIKRSLERAILSPNSSNMQLWEFYWIKNKEEREKYTALCLGQSAAKTAKQIVVFVTRKDLWRNRAQANLDMINRLYPDKPKSEQSRRERVIRTYYGKLIPNVYFDFLGLYEWLKYLMVLVTGLFRPIYREVRAKDMRVVVHKTCALAAQNFMISMAAIGYDTCPMEGSDTWRVKRLLKLPRGAEINMIVSCGIRKPEGVYGERFRIPFEAIYRHQ